MLYSEQELRQKHRNKVNNAQGHHFESLIKTACQIYRDRGVAEIDKTPEAFRVTRLLQAGKFEGRFVSLAQPDFKGTIKGGRAICFEAKHTTTEKMKRSVLTDEQMARLEAHRKLGAVTGICAGIQDRVYFVPWEVWKDMKNIYRKQYIKHEDIRQYQVRFAGAVMFLDNYIFENERGGQKC